MEKKLALLSIMLVFCKFLYGLGAKKPAAKNAAGFWGETTIANAQGYLPRFCFGRGGLQAQFGLRFIGFVACHSQIGFGLLEHGVHK